MISIDRFEEILSDLAEEIPQSFYEELNGGIVVEPGYLLHPEDRNGTLFGLGAVLSIIHAALETLVCVPVYFGQGLSGAETVRILLGLVLLGSFIHSMIDYALSLLIWRPVSGTMRTSRVS